MPSPFPGMDPYLERPAYWRMIHIQLIAELARKLNPILRPKYWVATEQHTYTLTLFGSNELIGIPDVMVIDRDVSALQTTGSLAIGNPVVAELPMPEETVERYLEIRDVESGEVVTAIEVLSPTDKVPKEGRKKYEAKRLKLLGSQTHLIEIDLLRSGDPMPMSIPDEDMTDYRILVSRSHQRPYADVYGFGVRDPIPEFPVPLRPGEDEPIVDLNAILHELYDLLSFDLVINYSENPIPSVSGEDGKWMEEILSSKSL